MDQEGHSDPQAQEDSHQQRPWILLFIVNLLYTV